MKRTLLVFVLLLLPTIALETVITQTYSVSYTCSGSAGPYPFTFPISDPTAMDVIENGTLISPTAYSIVPLNNVYDNGGSVTLNTPCASGTLLLQRNTPVTQASVYTDNRPLPMKSFENSLDKLTEILIERGNGGGGNGTVTVPSEPLYSVQTNYPDMHFGNELGDFLDLFPVAGPLTFTGAGINSTVVDNGTYLNGGAFNFTAVENGTTSVPNPASFIVNVTDNVQGGGNFLINATATNSTTPTGGMAVITANSARATNNEGTFPAAGSSGLSSYSNTGMDTGEQSLLISTGTYGSLGTSQSGVGNMKIRNCEGEPVDALSCNLEIDIVGYGQSEANAGNLSINTYSYGFTHSGQMTFNTYGYGSGSPVDGTEDSFNFIADGGLSSFNITAAYTSVSSGIRSNSASPTDLTGRLTLSGGGATYTLTATYASPPNCHADDVTTPAAGVIVSESTTVLTFTGNGTDVIKYQCLGMN